MANGIHNKGRGDSERGRDEETEKKGNERKDRKERQVRIETNFRMSVPWSEKSVASQRNTTTQAVCESKTNKNNVRNARKSATRLTSYFSIFRRVD